MGSIKRVRANLWSGGADGGRQRITERRRSPRPVCDDYNPPCTTTYEQAPFDQCEEKRWRKKMTTRRSTAGHGDAPNIADPVPGCRALLPWDGVTPAICNFHIQEQPYLRQRTPSQPLIGSECRNRSWDENNPTYARGTVTGATPLSSGFSWEASVLNAMLIPLLITSMNGKIGP